MLIRTEHSNGVVTYQSPLLTALGVAHGFSTRLGGVSRDPYATLNLGTLAKTDQTDHNTLVAENFRRLRAALQCPRHRRIEVRQVHGCAVWRPPAQSVLPNEAPCADAMICDQPDALLTIRTADCVPLLLSDPAGRHVAAVHAGWRGIIAGVVAATVNAYEQLGVTPDQLTAAIGPSIGVEHFQVGAEVAEQFEQANLDSAVDRRRGDKPHVDLRAAVRAQLIDAGLAAMRIDTTDRCTYAHHDEFFSHRRDHGRTGRMAAVIAARRAP